MVRRYKPFLKTISPTLKREPFRNQIVKLIQTIKECEDIERKMGLIVDLMKIFGKTPCCGQDFQLEKGQCMAIQCVCESYFCGWCRQLPCEIGPKSALQAHVCNCDYNPSERIVMREVGEDGVVRRVRDPHFKRFPNSKNPKQFEIQRKVKKWNGFIRKLDLTSIIGWIDKHRDEVLEAIDGGLCDAEFEKLVFHDTGLIQLNVLKPDEDVITRRVPLGPNGGIEFVIRGGGLPANFPDNMLLGFAITSAIQSVGINAEAVEEFQRVIAGLRAEMRDA